MASNTIPKVMTGVIIEKNGGTEVLQYSTDLPVPEPKDGQILVKNEFIGVNFIDTYFRTGLYKAPHFPYTLGREGAGVVVAKGSGDTGGLSEGDRVVWAAEGAYAEYSAVSSNYVTKIPSDISTEVAAAALLQGLTALTLIREAHHVQKGEWVLVHAAAGGTGLWLCQLLKAVGAHTIGTASTEEKRELARKAGAEVLVDYTKKGYVDEILKATGGKGVAAVFDGVGKATFDDSLTCVARKGSLVTFGNASGAVEPFSVL
jgi:NADPH:quinone reductase